MQRGREGGGRGSLQGNTVQNLAQLTSKLEHADNKADPGDTPPCPLQPGEAGPHGGGAAGGGGAADVGTGV